MQLLTFTAATLALANSVSAIQQGFNYGSTNADGSCRKYENFNTMFNREKNLAQPGFNSARLYTSIQCGAQNAPIEGTLHSYRAIVAYNI